MAPLYLEFRQRQDIFEVFLCITGQHRLMLQQVLDIFGILPDFDLKIMKVSQDLFDITSSVILGMRGVLETVKPNMVLVHGDTTTSVAAALSSFYFKIPVAHVEAGLRTRNIYSPWPEEINRQLTSRISSFHFAPTALSKQNLMAEGVREDSIVVSGNTVIDALFIVVEMLKEDSVFRSKVELSIVQNGYDIGRLAFRRLIIITGHRRENFGTGFLNICYAIKELATLYPDIDFVYPMHLNPNVRNPIEEVFSGEAFSNVFFIEPLDYTEFVYLMERSFLILTDSGGIQEEAPSLGKPVLVMRETTERPEAVSAGTVQLVGTDKVRIVKAVSTIIEKEEVSLSVDTMINPYGDGFASKRIVDFLTHHGF
jgi:UDP-N-acetylglucosamine 2-epimerase (non-hydrolysing)